MDICQLFSLTCATTVCGPLNETISYAVLYSCTNSECAEFVPIRKYCLMGGSNGDT